MKICMNCKNACVKGCTTHYLLCKIINKVVDPSGTCNNFVVHPEIKLNKESK